MPKSKKPDTGNDPDRLIRQPGGAYVSGDARFVVEQANGSWFLADHETADDFGQPRVAGPFATLKGVRDAIPRVRSRPTPLRKPIKQPKSTGKARAAQPPKAETWLDRLAPDERRRAQRMIRTLAKEGLDDAEALAKAHIESGARATSRGLAKRRLLARLDRVLADADGPARERVADTLAVLAGGGRGGSDLPGWALVETDPDGSPSDRPIQLD